MALSKSASAGDISYFFPCKHRGDPDKPGAKWQGMNNSPRMRGYIRFTVTDTKRMT